MNFHTRKWVKPEDLNPNGTLFGGSLLRWIDEEAAIYAIVQLGNQRVVTKYIWIGVAELSFPEAYGEELEVLEPLKVGRGYRFSFSFSITDIEILADLTV